MKKITVYLKDEQWKFIDSLLSGDLSFTEKVRLLLDQTIWAYRKGIFDERELYIWREGSEC